MANVTSYKLNAKDLQTVKDMVQKRNPELAIIELETNNDAPCAKIVHSWNFDVADEHHDTIDKNSSTFECLRNLLNQETSGKYHENPCIALINHIICDKHSGAKNDKMFALKWSPDTCCDRKNKMVYSSAWAKLKEQLGEHGVCMNHMVEANDLDDFDDKIVPPKA